MRITINAGSLKKLVRVLRDLASQLENLYISEEDPDVKAPARLLRVVKETIKKPIPDVQEVVDYYRSIHPKRERALGPKHKSWALIKRRIAEGYGVDELKTAILNNSKDDFWIKNNLHGIKNIMGNDSNLDKFIENEKKAKHHNAKIGYTSGSSEFGKTDIKDFGD